MSRHSGDEPDRDSRAAVLATTFERGTPDPRGFREVSAVVVHDTMGSARIVDVREPHEYTDDLGHIAEALLVPLGELEDAAARWDRRAPIVLVCRSGSRSAIGAVVLVRLGFSAVMNMKGGMLAWNDAELPVSR